MSCREVMRKVKALGAVWSLIVDGIQLNTSNYSDCGARHLHHGLGEFDGTQIVEVNQTSTLNKTQLTENPVHKMPFFSTPTHRGYLMYNGFTNEFDNDLNAAFGQFMTEG